jgi:hypothetical protein
MSNWFTTEFVVRYSLDYEIIYYRWLWPKARYISAKNLLFCFRIVGFNQLFWKTMEWLGLLTCEDMSLNMNLNKWSRIFLSFFFFSLKIFFIIHLFTRAYIVWVISPPYPPPTPFPPSPPHFQAEPVLPLSQKLFLRWEGERWW